MQNFLNTISKIYCYSRLNEIDMFANNTIVFIEQQCLLYLSSFLEKIFKNSNIQEIIESLKFNETVNITKELLDKLSNKLSNDLELNINDNVDVKKTN